MKYLIGWNGLTALFIVLKLVGVITWSWFWVLLPTLWPFFLLFWIVMTVLVMVGWFLAGIIAVLLIGAIIGGITVWWK